MTTTAGARGVYVPTGPYVFQSGKRQGKAAELLMFDDYGFLVWLYRKFESEFNGGRNRLYCHLEWLLRQGETRQSRMLCPHCQQQPVKYFSVLGLHSPDGISIGWEYTCCSAEACIEKVRNWAGVHDPDFLEFRFSRLIRFRTKFDRAEVVQLFRRVFSLPDRLTRQAAFKFFKDSQSS